jgi:hypothetical protein
VQMRILGVGDLGLPAEAQTLHGNAVRRIDVGADDEGAMLVQDLVGAQDVSGRADLTAAKAIFRHTQQQEKVLHEADSGALGKDGQDVEAELGGELEPGEHQDASEQASELGQPLRFVGLKSAEVFEQLQILDLAPEVGVAPNRVVIGQGDGVEAAFLSAVQNIEDAGAGLLKVDGGRSVNVKVDAAPGQIL